MLYRMTIHKEGYRTIIIALIVFLLIITILNAISPQQTYWHYALYVLAALTFGLIVRFFRLPERKAISENSKIISGADGTVVAIEEVEENEYLHQKCLLISVFMSVHNVHVNWYPVNGTVEYFKYHPGKFLVAWHPKSSTLNERTTVVIKTPESKQVLVRQIAGFVARRVVCYAKKGTNAVQGEQMGFIKFGSRVDHFIPIDAKVHVQLNDKVVGTQSVLASL